MKEKNSLSLCLIVRDEEQTLARCLASVRHLADEMIVVDTGSRDATAAIAAAQGASVFSFPWNGDFAAARNYALAQASSHWILVLDADEELQPVSRTELFAFLEEQPADGYFVTVRSLLNKEGAFTDDYVVRLFRKSPCYRFVGPIHEQIAGSIRDTGGALTLVPLILLHYGYLPAVLTAKNKFIRNTTILRNSLEKDPADPFLLYSLALEYLQRREYRQAGCRLRQALPLLTGKEGYLPHLLCSLLLTDLAAPEEEGKHGAPSLFTAIAAMLPDNGDAATLQALWLLRQARYQDMLEVLAAGTAQTSLLLTESQHRCLLGDAYTLNGRQAEAVIQYREALLSSSESLYPLRQLCRLLHAGLPPDWRLPPEVLLRLAAPVSQAGDISLLCTFLLLIIREAAAVFDASRIEEMCRRLLHALKEENSLPPAASCLSSILRVSAQSWLLECQLAAIFPGQIQVLLPGIAAEAQSHLRLAASLLSEASQPEALHYWKEVLFGETNTDRQSG